MLDSLEESLFLFDSKQRLTWYNRAAGKLYYSVSGKKLDKDFDFNELLTEEQQLSFKAHLGNVLAGKQVHFEWNYRKAADKWLSVSLYPYAADNGRFTGICGSLRDITERKNADNLIKSNEKKYRTLVNSLSEGVILQTLDRKILTANKNAALILGVSMEELAKNGFPLPGWDMIDKNEKPISARDFLSRKNGRISPLKSKPVGIRRGHDIQWLRVSVAGVSSSQQAEPYAMVISFEDITEQKRISRELRVLSMVARETLNAVLILKPGGEAVWINEGFTRLTGYSSEEIVGRTSRQMLNGPSTDDAAAQEMEQSRRKGMPFNKEHVIYTKTGEEKRVKMEGQPMRDENGELTMFFVIITDITEQRRLEEGRLQNEIDQRREITRLMMQAQEAERNNLGRELHDNINQLLAAAALQLSYCSDNYELARPVIDECRDNIRIAIEEIRNLSHKMVMPRFSASSLQYELSWLIAHYKYTQDIRLDTTGWNEAHISHTIKQTFFRIAQEQLYNIHKHAQAKKVLVCIKSDAERALMSISDDGIGFDPSQEKKGIGMTNIINRAEAYNGTSEFISAPGKGCQLLVSIPFEEAPPASLPPIR